MSRTLKLLREEGYRCGIVERFIGPMCIRSDLFNIIDVIAIKPGEILGVQVCGQDFASHVRKLEDEYLESSVGWLESGAKLRIVGWRKLKKGARRIWTPKVKEIFLEDLIFMT